MVCYIEEETRNGVRIEVGMADSETGMGYYR
jgi:hypothetical protein